MASTLILLMNNVNKRRHPRWHCLSCNIHTHTVVTAFTLILFPLQHPCWHCFNGSIHTDSLNCNIHADNVYTAKYTLTMLKVQHPHRNCLQAARFPVLFWDTYSVNSTDNPSSCRYYAKHFIEVLLLLSSCHSVTLFWFVLILASPPEHAVQPSSQAKQNKTKQ